jgi:hypothetical protein
MSRKHYREIAAIIAGEYACNGHDRNVERALHGVMLSLADVCKRDKSRFDRERFYDACGIPRYLGSGR